MSKVVITIEDGEQECSLSVSGLDVDFSKPDTWSEAEYFAVMIMDNLYNYSERLDKYNKKDNNKNEKTTNKEIGDRR